MLFKCRDFNGAEDVIRRRYREAWEEVKETISGMPLHIKASDQKGKQGTPIFDAVGTNSYLKRALAGLSWDSGIPIPQEYKFLGKEVDFGKDGSIVEVQFSNYPFLLNNLLRSELFYKAVAHMPKEPVGLLLIITKSGMFPASNSTLYYERAVEQISALAEYSVFDIPIRLLGLFEPKDEIIEAVWTEYEDPRYSRTIICQKQHKLQVSQRLQTIRCDLSFL